MVRIQLSPAVSRQTMGSSAAEAARIAHSDRRRPSGRAKHGTARRQLCETCTQCHRRESLTLARTLRGRIMRIMKYLRGRIMRIMKYHRIRLALLGVCLLAPAACAPPGDVPRPQAQIPALAPGTHAYLESNGDQAGRRANRVDTPSTCGHCRPNWAKRISIRCAMSARIGSKAQSP